MKDIKVVNEVAGSVVTDKMLDKVNDLTKANREIGELKGELKVANQLLDQNIEETERKLAESKKEVVITVKEAKNDRIYNDPFSYILNAFGMGNVVSTTTVGTENLTEIADAAVKSQAKLDVEKAEKAKKDAEAKLEKEQKDAEAKVKAAKEEVESIKKSHGDKVTQAIERAERENLRDIAELKLEVKALQKESDLLLDNISNIEKERDLALEVMDKRLRLYKERIQVLETPTKTMMDAIQSRINAWWFKRRIHNLSK